MATIKFILQSAKENAPIYLRLSISKTQSLKRKTRETINPEFWNSKTGKTKNITSANETTLKHIEEVKTNLSEIESFIFEQYRKRNETEIINGVWLDEIITAYYTGGRRQQQLDFLDNYLEYYKTEILPFRKYKGTPITYRTKQKHLTIISKLKSFLKSLNKSVKVSDYGETMGNDFVTYLRNVENLNENTVGKYLKYSKTIIKDARKVKVQISDDIDDIKGFTVETPTVIFLPNEIETIQKLNFLNPKWEITRDWLIVGIHTGQRASDLFTMNKEMITTNSNGRKIISLKQQKVKKRVNIPMHKEVEKILEKYKGDFPPLFSQNMASNQTLFNRYLKDITERAGIDRLDYGHIYEAKTKKYIYGKYPLYKIVSSHLCRRTFATMYYGIIPTPILKSITKHATETEFLKYIAKTDDDMSDKIFSYWDDLEKKTAETETIAKTVNN